MKNKQKPNKDKIKELFFVKKSNKQKTYRTKSTKTTVLHVVFVDFEKRAEYNKN
jgi:hypothetical protein